MSSTETEYQLQHGSNASQSEKRTFKAIHLNDALTQFASKVTEFDNDKAVWAAHVSITRLPDDYYPKGCSIVGWTKTSDERPTEEGVLVTE